MRPDPKQCYRKNGKITARFSHTEEKMVLAHKGSLAYRKVFYLLVGVMSLYLAGLFIFIR